ncbi:c-type cytochrome biogenesis protein CcmI [Thalassovita taeanensis]|uniref:Cytochrome c-type biogenesis protein CcmH n=1 Tax=Thalassovita taeanensis TaxID=657014 RepID=A0A1H9HVR1_9RHOB|nr:c-type cytochrome biogenesis protein CcmI [Thalassovita taeanensis]SEQ66453.1 cytochrome c-type biogenesis protein CcmH [Thalassovita taeanensis]
MLFWIITGALALTVAVLLALALTRGRGEDEAPAAYDLRVYRDQLKEVERDLARGVIAAEDAERTRSEISRRILAADAQLQQGGRTGGQPKALAMGVAGLTVVGLLAGSFLLYRQLGAPGYDDLSLKTRIEMAKDTRANRPSQAEVEANRATLDAPLGQPAPEYAALMDKLRKAVAERPDDLQGVKLLARNEAALGNFVAAQEAQARVLTLLGDAATANDYVDYADTLILATGGYVSPEAEAALLAALARDPRQGAARYYMGLMFAQTGRPDTAFRIWEELLREGPADAPWIAPIRGQIQELAMLAGAEFTLPPEEGLKGPDAADVQAAGEMSAEDRQEMIRGMVSTLSERLATEGGTPAEWARLIGAYGVLGEPDRAREIWTEAQQVFADKPNALAEVRAGAARAGVAE